MKYNYSYTKALFFVAVVFYITPLSASDFRLNHNITWEREASIKAAERYQRVLKENAFLSKQISTKTVDENQLSKMMDQFKPAIVFKAKLSDKIYKDHIPLKADISFESFNIRVAKNEWQSLQFGLVSQADLAMVHFEVSELKHDNGRDLIKANSGGIRRYTVYNILAKKKKSNEVSPDMDIDPELKYTGELYKEEPVVLLDLPGVDIPKYTCQAFWLDLFIDKNVPEGIYRGQINIFSNGILLSKKTLQVEVLPFELDLALEWSRGAYISKFIDKKEAINLIENGHTQVSWWTDANYSLKLENDTIKADFSPYVRYLNMLDELGMPGPHVIFLGGDSPKLINKIFKQLGRPTITNGRNKKYRKQYANTDLSPPFEKYLTQSLKQFYQQMKACGHKDIPVVILDEPDHQPRPERLFWYNRVFSMMEKNCPELNTFGVFYHKNDEKKLSHDHDIWSTNRPSQKLYRACKRAEKKMYTYHGGFTFYQSAGMPRFKIGIIPWVYDAEGTFYWAIWNHKKNERHLDDIFFPNQFENRATTIARAPERAEYGPLSTLVHKGFREAVDDARYIKTLEKLIKTAKKGVARREAIKHEEWLINIKTKIRKKSIIRAGRVYKKLPGFNRRFPFFSLTITNSLGEKINLENPEKFSVFLREDIQRRIVSLLTVMGES